ncbi:MAG: hypothetical protein LBT93_09180 [Treponema sp.]|nr:hypothetical protein [Treponema sp.]
MMILLWLNLSSFTAPLVKWMMQHNIRPSMAWFLVAGILVVIITGALMFGIISFISRQEDKYLQKHQPPVDPSGAHYSEIDNILHSMEVSLAKIKENTKKMKIQTERIVELNQRLFGGSAVSFLKSQNPGELPPPETSPHKVLPEQRLITDRLFGSTDIYTLGSPKPRSDQGETPKDPGVLSPEQKSEFIAMIERITCFLYYIKK